MGLNSSAGVLISYGKCLTELARYEEAEEQLVLAYSFLRDREAGDEATVRAVETLVELYEAWGKPEKAAEYLLRNRGTCLMTVK